MSTKGELVTIKLQHRVSQARSVGFPRREQTSGQARDAVTRRVQSSLQRRNAHLKCCLRAATGYAFTIVLAAFALTFTSLPKAILVPALVAGLWRVLIMQRPGMTNLPAFFTSAVARAAKLSMIPAHCFGFSSFCSASVVRIAPFVKAFAPAFIAFIAFMGDMAVEATCNVACLHLRQNVL